MECLFDGYLIEPVNTTIGHFAFNSSLALTWQCSWVLSILKRAQSYLIVKLKEAVAISANICKSMCYLFDGYLTEFGYDLQKAQRIFDKILFFSPLPRGHRYQIIVFNTVLI